MFPVKYLNSNSTTTTTSKMVDILWKEAPPSGYACDGVTRKRYICDGVSRKFPFRIVWLWSHCVCLVKLWHNQVFTFCAIYMYCVMILVNVAELGWYGPELGIYWSESNRCMPHGFHSGQYRLIMPCLLGYYWGCIIKDFFNTCLFNKAGVWNVCSLWLIRALKTTQS